MFCRNTWTIIFNAYPGHRMLIAYLAAGLYSYQGALSPRIFYGILHQIGKHLAQILAVAVNPQLRKLTGGKLNALRWQLAPAARRLPGLHH